MTNQNPGEEAAESQNFNSQEKLTYNDTDVPIIRAGMPEMFVALKPPDAQPYLMVPRDAQPQQIADFFAARIPQVEELRADMLKRFEKSPSLKCRYQTGDVAYVMGRPFQLRVYPLGQPKEKVRGGVRGRATSKYAIDAGISLLTLYVVHPRNFDEAKLAFNGYAESVILRNATSLAADFARFLMPGKKVPPVRMRAMRERWSSSEAGAIWLSTDIIPYPPDCLVYTLWRELEKKSELPEEAIRERFEQILPGWREAQRMLSERAKPFSNQ